MNILIMAMIFSAKPVIESLLCGYDEVGTACNQGNLRIA